MYVTAFSRWKRAEAKLAEEGEILWLEMRDTHQHVVGKKPVTNPLVRIAESAARQAHKYGEALGLSPASRIKQGVEFKAEEHRESIFDILKRQKSNDATS